MNDQMTQDILLEIQQGREKQRNRGYDEEHDDLHVDQEIAAAASFLAWPDEYTDGSGDAEACLIPHPKWAHTLLLRHRGDRRKQLVIAATLLVAEIERLDRAEGVD